MLAYPFFDETVTTPGLFGFALFIPLFVVGVAQLPFVYPTTKEDGWSRLHDVYVAFVAVPHYRAIMHGHLPYAPHAHRPTQRHVLLPT